jgi:hypothetical protein
MLADALNERVFVTIDGRHRKITTREAIVTRMVNKSATADLLAINMLIDTLTDVDRKAGVASPPPEPRRLDEADNGVVRQFVERIRQQVLREIADGKTADPRK